MNKHTFLLFMITISSITGYSQTDSIKTPDLKGNLTEERYDSIYGRYVLSQEAEIKHLWKLNLADVAVFNVNLGFEKKLGKSWSSDSYLTLGVPSRNGYYGKAIQWSVSQQLKYYYNLKRRERLGRKTNGFNANYLAIEIYAGENHDPKPGFSEDIIMETGSYNGIGIRYGWQRRMGNLWYFEPYAGFDYAIHRSAEYHDRAPVFNFKGSTQRQFLTVFGIKAGFAIESFFKLKNYEPANTLVPHDAHPLQLRKDVNHLWKTNLVDLGLFKLNLGYELRMTKNISLDSYLKIGLNIKPHENNVTGDDIHLEQQIKYYLNFKPRQPSENFSGDYLSLSLFYSNYSYYYDYRYPNYNSIYRQIYLNHYGLGMKYGLQRRIGNIGYFDVFVGMKYLVRETPVITSDFTTITKSNRYGFVPEIGFRAGFALGSGSKRGRTIK